MSPPAAISVQACRAIAPALACLRRDAHQRSASTMSENVRSTRPQWPPCQKRNVIDRCSTQWPCTPLVKPWTVAVWRNSSVFDNVLIQVGGVVGTTTPSPPHSCTLMQCMPLDRPPVAATRGALLRQTWVIKCGPWAPV